MMGRPRIHPLPGVATCAGCGVEFQQNYTGQRYHDQHCFIRNFNRAGAEHSKKGGKAAGAKRGKQIKDGASGTGYVKTPGSDTHLHRTVAEQVLGRPLKKTEVVHHEDLDKQNNDPANLIVFPTQAAHARHHKLNHPGSLCDCVCVCLKEVMP